MFFNKPVRIVVKNRNLAIEAKTGANLYNALVAEKVIPPTLCRGNGQCGKCKVHIKQRNISKPNKKEQLVLARINLNAGFRLACQTVIKDDMIVDTTEISAPAANDMIVKTINKEDHAYEPELISEVPSPSVSANTIKATPSLKNTRKTVISEKSPEIDKFYTDKNVVTDGLLLVHYKQQLRYVVYSAAIDGIIQEGVVDNTESLVPYIENGTLSDYVHDVLKIKDIDRMIIFSDETNAEGESLFDIASYIPFDIGATPCELIRPLPEAGDLSLFFRLFSIKGKERLMISLDKLDYTYYFSEDNIVRIPNRITLSNYNLLKLVTTGANPVSEISDDLLTLNTLNNYGSPDSLPLSLLMKVAARMADKKLIDSEFKICSRNNLPSSVPLEYVVKITQYNGDNAFYLHRDKESSLIITQDMLSMLASAQKFIHYAIEYTESNFGHIEAIIISTPMPLNGLVDNLIAASLVPKRHENIVLYNPGDSSVFAVKLFQEANVRSYIQRYYGGFIKAGQ
ncbi:MAG: 2Fe-2S iron-sulfur cluster binding domain-containing protein [Deferribacteraceae bacterium]|jgi:ferredoxin|nr:2Fe-2S iron-sulfur cluster binding domain-containing protein [Deferribacteraceae bacterium]